MAKMARGILAAGNIRKVAAKALKALRGGRGALHSYVLFTFLPRQV